MKQLEKIEINRLKEINNKILNDNINGSINDLINKIIDKYDEYDIVDFFVYNKSEFGWNSNVSIDVKKLWIDYVMKKFF